VLLQDKEPTLITRIGGIDMAFLNNSACVAYILVDYSSLKIMYQQTMMVHLSFPYIPTFLCFREGQPIINILNSIEYPADILLINAHGIAHPFSCGCASYVGVLADIPTIGVTQQILCGTYQNPKEVGSYTPLQYQDKSVGWVLKSKEGCNPIFISPGHLMSLPSSLKIVLKCITTHKLPDPLHFAHRVANEEKNKISQLPGRIKECFSRVRL